MLLTTSKEIMEQPEYLAEVTACWGGKNKDHFPLQSPWEPPLHFVPREMGCCGILDEICPALRAHDHPLILVGKVAHRWMGARGFTGRNIIDILLRNSQLHSVASDIVRTGHWRHFNTAQELQRFSVDPELEQFTPKNPEVEQLLDADMVLERTHCDAEQISHIRLWSEESYQINIDGCSLIEVPDVIPTFLQAMWSHKVQYANSKPGLASNAKWLIENLTRYLYLEVSPRRHAIVFQLDEPYDAMMEDYMSKYKRKPSYALTSSRFVRVKRWDPTTFPPDALQGWSPRIMPAEPGITENQV
ncbi:hypothetical protein BU24DRAFT_445598 [Aaosphaeria arxii CBS 175.79]|uniref:Uncharacterized protein n=1 Tax=Aaosphaeria arxii CBS 175.79 TaxID=1450172 RepID=A0A6A5Y505_9PLEO|nr:uncharacterized protein BU24DRAFT_445598 [Aaosphaeria arxii CBS 175.79]KAF2020346.1 hypothetical protein BU24DRAFT_445598 [Aaosphaeria arxii CBS 175.79]